MTTVLAKYKVLMVPSFLGGLGWVRSIVYSVERFLASFLGMTGQCMMLMARRATMEELLAVHSRELIDSIQEKCKKVQDSKHNGIAVPKAVHSLGGDEDTYLNEASFHCARIAAGSCIAAVQAILR